MSEYIEIKTEIDHEANVVLVTTILVLSGLEEERYLTAKAMEKGSALAQSLSQIEGIRKLIIEGKEMAVSHDPTIPSHIVASELSAALKEFFL
ncbi:MAG: hypothetical protein WA996_19015 [Candidatus Promineifilaceae bacterium]